MPGKFKNYWRIWYNTNSLLEALSYKYFGIKTGWVPGET